MTTTIVEPSVPRRIHPGVLAAAAAVGERVSSLVRQRLAEGTQADDAFRGLHIGADEAEQILTRPPIDQQGSRTLPPFRLPPTIADSPLDRACAGLGLDHFEAAVLILCLLPEIDGKYGPLIGFLHDDVTRKQPSIELALTLFAPAEGTFEYLAHFTPDARLLSWHLVQLTADEALIRQSLQLDRAVLWYLLGEIGLDPSLFGLARIEQAEQLHASAALPALAGLVERELRDGTSVLLYGEDEQSTILVAATASERNGRRLLVIDGANLAEQEHAETLLRTCLRDAVLRRLAPCVTHAATLLQQVSTRAAACRRHLEACPVPVILISPSGTGEVAFAGAGIVPIEVPAPRALDRLHHWQRVVRERGIDMDERTLLALAETEGLRGALIEEVAAVAFAAATASGEPPTGVHVQRAARGALRQRAPSLTLMQPRFSWEEMILPVDRLVTLRHLCSRVRYRSQVQETWGLGRGTVPGVTALFAGQPGTGKSMAAEVIAADLGLDLCKIDLAQVVSKYIGETEKNLARIFDEAEQCGVVLVFDEADALFGKRSDVKDSHDRYANVETSYLLQRMERYRGLAVLTTNMRANLDEAFTRRIGVSIDFPLPSPADRLRLWKRALAGAPYDPNLNLQEVAEKLELAGGAIMNAGLAAAYLAAEERDMVDSERLLRAVRWELQKVGRLMSADALAALLPSTSASTQAGR